MIHQSSHHKHSLSDDENKQLLSVLERQNEITSLLVNQQSLFFLPKRDIPIFDGDPLQFKTFIIAFEHSIETKAHSAKDCLHFLEQFTRGQPRDLVRSCVHMPTDSGYAKAKSLLQEHFGCSLKIIAAYMNKVLSWPALQAEDVKALQAFSFLLRECCNVMENNGCMHELDVPANMQTIIKKLPFKLRDRWRNDVCDLKEKFKRRDTFSDIVRFVERQVKIASDPLFGDIQDSSSRPKKDVGVYKSQQRLKIKGSSLATVVGDMQKKADPEVKKGRETAVIELFMLWSWTFLGHMPSTGKEDTWGEDDISERKWGFSCLCPGHISKDCKRWHHCKVCSLRHRTMLHVFSKEREIAPVHKKKEVETTSGSASISAQSSGLTGAGEQGCTLSIVPVRVKSTKSQKTIITYAFLDPGSSASFWTEELMNRLNVTGRHTSILLRTMGQEKVVGSNIVSDLEIAGLNEDIFSELPDVFTQRSMPVHYSNIPLQEDLARWSHLKNLKIVEINSGVDLLIGTNVPKALEPWNVI
ncbi:PREDICTED: uncharacterized protein LOC106921875 isoform X1 [Poecilia mexicana]|uniref:uncharacterized protein LOC106921875 isoform X1 n=1 Tax=Poecilia mexicana TaxID=48701 RepID=UPI00072E65ED|nr:PREDICTED: uncharacterized protein LOC106921875 isoform X1 [Poecilia mexicana]